MKKKISRAERAKTELSLIFIFNMGMHCDDKQIVEPIIRGMVEDASPDEKLTLKDALTHIKTTLMFLDYEDAVREIVSEADVRPGVRLVAETFARAAQTKLPIGMLKMALPEKAISHRVRQLLRRKNCPTLASLCTPIVLSECRVA